MHQNALFEKATQHILCEVLGFDEGRTYYLLLTKNKKTLEKEFSYSKGYRMMKSLFLKGVVGKIKEKGKDYFSYVLLPPSFLHFKKVDKKVIRALEKVYLENYKKFFETDFSQIIVKDDRGLILFLLKYVMKEDAKLFGVKFSLTYLGKNKNKVVINDSIGERRKGLIDNRLSFEFSAIRGANSDDYIGYISNKS